MLETSEPELLDRLFAQICRLKHARVHNRYEALGLYRRQPRMSHALWHRERKERKLRQFFLRIRDNLLQASGAG